MRNKHTVTLITSTANECVSSSEDSTTSGETSESTTNTTSCHMIHSDVVEQKSYQILTTFTCTIHGSLPISSFYASDLKIGRHRCRTCRSSTQIKTKSNQPMKRLWTEFVKKAQRRYKLKPDQIQEISNYIEYGRFLLKCLFSNKHNINDEDKINADILKHDLVLIWPSGANNKLLDMQKLVIVTRKAVHRNKRRSRKMSNK